MSQPLFQEPASPPPAPPKPQPPNPQPAPTPSSDLPADPAKPPWGDDFSPEKAWSLVQNLRGDKEKQKAALDQAAADRQELDELRNKALSADERTLKEATEKAAEDARSATDAAWRDRYLTSQLKGVAGRVIQDADDLNLFMEIVNPAKFATESGELDESKLMGHLTAVYLGRQREEQQGAPQWGQYSAPGQQPPQKPGDAGRAEAARRRDRNKPTQN